MENELTTEQVVYETTDAIASLLERLENRGNPMRKKPEDIQNLEKCLGDAFDALQRATRMHRLTKEVLGE